jgi:hypothetical protein
MVTEDTFSSWLQQAGISEQRLTPDQRGLLQGAHRFRHQQGDDYYSTRVLSHFLLHCGGGFQVAQIARLLRLSRPTASRQRGLSSKQAIQQAHHRMDGRPYGKLLPRFAGPVAEFLLTHPDASRYDILDFIQRTFAVRVSTVALHHFLKRYGLDRGSRAAARTAAPAEPAPPPGRDGPPAIEVVESVPASQPLPRSAPPFSSPTRSTRAPSC